MDLAKMPFERLLICCCADYKHVSLKAAHSLRNSAEAVGVEVILIADLCFQMVQFPEVMKDLVDEKTAVVACYPRAVRALFDQAQIPAPEILNLRTKPVAEVLASLNLQEVGARPAEIGLEYDDEWHAWYPVIDRSRCTNCGKCLDYCIFGVYGREENTIQVTAPKNCKTDCPACARMCPQQAIIFPKHPDGPINGDEPACNEVPQLGKKLFDEDLYAKLAARRNGRKSKLLKD